MATKAETLHLTAAEVEDFDSMGPLGKHAVELLYLWREASEAPWEPTQQRHYGTNNFYYDYDNVADSLTDCKGAHSHNGPQPEIHWRMEEDGKAIVRARNTAELGAALTYWGLKQYFVEGHVAGLDSTSMQSFDEYWEDLLEEYKLKIAAISSALSEVNSWEE